MDKLILALSVAGIAMLSACGEDAAVAEAETALATDVAQVDAAADGVDYAGGPSETMPAMTPAATASAVTFDGNYNGLFERNEYGAYGDGVFGDWDLDDDNRLARNEFDDGWKTAGWRNAGTAWGAFDDNNDGFLDDNEFFGDDEFGAWDRDRSGILEKSEWFGA